MCPFSPLKKTVLNNGHSSIYKQKRSFSPSQSVPRKKRCIRSISIEKPNKPISQLQGLVSFVPIDIDTKKPFSYSDNESDAEAPTVAADDDEYDSLLVASQHTYTSEPNVDNLPPLPRSSQFDLLPNSNSLENSGISTVDLIVSPFEKCYSEWSYERRSHLRYHLKNLVAVSNGIHFYKNFEIIEKDTVELALSIGDFVQVVFGAKETPLKKSFVRDPSEVEVHIGCILALSSHGEDYLAHCCWLNDIPYFKKHHPLCFSKCGEMLKRYRNRLNESDAVIATDAVSSIDVKAINCDVKVVSSIEAFESPEDTSDVMYFTMWRYDREAEVLRIITSVKDTMDMMNPFKHIYEPEENFDPVKRLIRNLQLDYVPDVIPCRKKEADFIFNFLQDSINAGGTGQLLYVCGMPGTGKTATVMKVLKQLQLEQVQLKLQPFKVAYVNAMELNESSECYRVLASKLLGKEIANHLQAYRALNSYFCGDNNVFGAQRKSDLVNLIVVDEADYLATGRLDVFYTLFSWPSKENAKVILILLCNTMDLPARMNRCSSRLGVGYVNFQPYRYDEIETIVRDRIKDGLNLFDSTAIRWCARIISNFSGDVRKALHIYRRALELKKGNQVKPRDIKAAENELYDSALSTAVKCFPWGVKAFLAAAVAEYQDKTQRELPLVNISKRFETIVQNFSDYSTPPSVTHILALLVRMNIISVTSYSPTEFGAADGVDAAATENIEKSVSPLGKMQRNANNNSTKRSKLKISHEIDEKRGDLAIEFLVHVEGLKGVLLEEATFDRFLF